MTSNKGQNTMNQAEEIGRKFASLLKDYLSPEDHAEMVRRNGTAEYAGCCCASHDFVDANVFMDEAFSHVMGRESSDPFDDEGNLTPDVLLIEDAWDWFRKSISEDGVKI